MVRESQVIALAVASTRVNLVGLLISIMVLQIILLEYKMMGLLMAFCCQPWLLPTKKNVIQKILILLWLTNL